MLYLATASSPSIREVMAAGGLGQMVTPDAGNKHVPGALWAHDNGCFAAKWTVGKWFSALDSYVGEPDCLFAVVPDVVGDSKATDELWTRYSWAVKGLGYKVAYVTQDGCEAVPYDADAVFTGGTDEWKLGTRAQELVADCRQRGLWCHMGRVNSLRRLQFAAAHGYDSVDGTYLAFGPDKNLPILMRWLDSLPPSPPRKARPMTFRGPTDAEQFRVQYGRFGERFYFDPLPADDTWPMMDPEEDPYPSVSTIKKVTSRDFSQVAARRVAVYVTDHLDSLTPIIKANPEGAIDLMVGADRRGLNEAGDRGTAVHAVMENLAKGIEPTMVNTDASAFPYVESCKAFLSDMQPEFIYNEVVCISRSYFYGGTLDCILKINGKTYLVDWKSRKAGKHDAYIEEGWQIAAYAKADYYVIDVDGIACRVPPPELDGGLIVSICPGDDSYKVYPVDIDKGFEGFISMRSLWEKKNNKFFKPLGRPVELMPRLYVPAHAEAMVQTMVAAGEAAVPGPPAAPWDPFADAEDDGDDLLAGLPTGDAEGSTHPLTLVPDLVPLSPEAQARADAHDAYDPVLIGDWVRVEWYERMNVGGQVHEALQSLEGWLGNIGSDSQVTITDDNSNIYKIPGNKNPSVYPAQHPEPAKVVAVANPMDEDSAVSPTSAPQAPPSVMDKLTHVTPAKSEVLSDHEAVRAWLRRRLESDVQQLGGQTALLKYWPVDLRNKPLDSEGKNVFTDDELHRIEEALNALESALSLSFHEAKPEYVHPEPEPVVLVAVYENNREEDSYTQDAPSVDIMVPPVVLAPEADADAHPDDIAAMIEKAVTVSQTLPYTWKRIEEQARTAGMPNLRKAGVKVSHLTLLDDLIVGYTEAVAARRVAVEELLDGLDAMGMLAVIFAAGAVMGEDSEIEPNEDYIERISLLTSGLKSGKLEFYKGDDDAQSLGVSADTTAALRKLHPENVKLFRVLNPVLTKYGFNSINRVGELRRTPLATLLVLEQ